MRLKNVVCVLLLFGLVNFACQRTEELSDFTEEDEMLLGEKLSQAIAESDTYVIISPEANTTSYSYANSRLLELTSSSAISKGEDFNWSITLLEDESRQAFALPGGYLYVTSGMIFYLDNEDQFAGLLAHLIAHVNESHVSEILFFRYGVNGLKTIMLQGNTEDLGEVVQYLDLFDGVAQFSRSHELEADTLTVSILSETSQSCESSGLLLDRVLNLQPEQQSQFISAHRIDTSRVSSIAQEVQNVGCDSAIDEESRNRYRSFRNSLP